MANLQLRDLEKQYDRGPKVIKGVSLDIADGELMVLVGPSGCGKSTTLRMIAGLEEITDGDLFIDGVRSNDIAPSQRGVAMVFQNYALYPHMTVADNMGFSLRVGVGLGKQEVRAAVVRAAEILQITHLLDRRPRELSGGQRQRVAIGRAIVRKPKVFLFDEPLSNLDAALRVQMRVELARLHQELGATMVYVTHDQTEAMTLGDRIAVFNDGVIEQVGRPLDLYDRPANQFVAGFLGSPRMNFVRCAVAGQVAETLALRVDGQVPLPLALSVPPIEAGTEVTLGVRPEHLEIAPDGEGIPARVELTEHLGDTQIVYASLPGTHQSVTVKRAVERISLRAGEVVRLRPRADACHVFGPDGRNLRVA